MKRYIVLWSHDGGRIGSVPLTEENLLELRRKFNMSLIQRDITGTEHYRVFGKMRSQKGKGVHKNPPQGAVQIYDKIISIRAQKGKRSLWPRENFEHNFQKDKTSASIYGLPDGSLLIKSKKGKRLWKKFNYRPEDI